MAARNWNDEHVARIEKLEEILFRPEVTEVRIEGDGPVTVVSRGSESIAEDLSMPEEILRDFVNELLLPYLSKKAPTKKSSKSGNPAKRAAENEALGVSSAQQSVKVLAKTEIHDADLTLPHSTEKGLSIRVREHNIWPPLVPKAQITMRKWLPVAEESRFADSSLSFR